MLELVWATVIQPLVMGLAGASIKFSTLHSGFALKALAVAAGGAFSLPEQHILLPALQRADTCIVAQHCMFLCTSITIVYTACKQHAGCDAWGFAQECRVWYNALTTTNDRAGETLILHRSVCSSYTVAVQHSY